ncbi:MAG: class I SAM-dependent rRNA methyltransferase [Brevinematales bacterium]
MGFVRLKKGRDKLSKNFHPWVYSQAIDKAEGVKSGDIVKVLDSENNFIAYGFYNNSSKIALRLIEWNERKSINREWFESKIESAICYRKFLSLDSKTNCYRLIFGEADGLPGIVLDKYSNYLVIQLSLKALETYIEMLIDIIVKKLNPDGIYLIIDKEMATKENIKLKDKVVYGSIPDEIELIENGIKYIVNVKAGQKTGFFIDQRNNREIIRKYSENKSVLDVFCYSGGFSLNATYAGARFVYSLDSSKEAISLLEKNFKLNNFNVPEIYNDDAFVSLRSLLKNGEKYDVIVLDPPKLSKRDKDKENAMRAYKDLNMQAMRLLNKNGILFTFSCSGNISREDLKKIVAWAAIDSQRSVKIVENLFQSEDHPIKLSYPESEYLKGFVCFVE